MKIIISGTQGEGKSRLVSHLVVLEMFREWDIRIDDGGEKSYAKGGLNKVEIVTEYAYVTAARDALVEAARGVCRKPSTQQIEKLEEAYRAYEKAKKDAG